MVKSRHIMENIGIPSHSRHGHSFPEEKHTLYRSLCPIISFLSLYGCNLTYGKNFYAFPLRCFTSFALTVACFYNMYLLITHVLNLSISPLVTPQIFVLVLVLSTIITVFWMLKNLSRLRTCLKTIFLIADYSWHHASAMNCKSPYKRFRLQLLPCVIFTIFMPFAPVIIMIMRHVSLSTKQSNYAWHWYVHDSITCQISEIIMCCFAIPFQIFTMGLFQGISCMLSSVLSEHVDLTVGYLRKLDEMNAECEEKCQNDCKNPSNTHLFYIEKPSSKTYPTQPSLDMHSNEFYTEMPLQTQKSCRDRNNDYFVSLLEYHHYLMGIVRQVDELFSSINLIWYSSEILEIVLCVRASNLNDKPNLIWIVSSLASIIPLVFRTLYAARVNSRSMKLFENIFKNGNDLKRFVPNEAIQLQYYCLGLSMSPAQLTVCGLFAISGSLILTIGGTIVSYGIVLYGG